MYHMKVLKMRASYYFLGALLGKFGKASVHAGGCPLGDRPMTRGKGFFSVGAECNIDHGMVDVNGELVGNQIYLDVVSVGLL